jgi:purine nucleoside permease
LRHPASSEAIKVVVVTMFEPGRGRPGELARFRAGLQLEPWNLPDLPRGTAWRNRAGVAALVAGVGPVNTAVNLLTFGLLAGADFRKTYWLICGIGGGNPARCSLGSAVWADWVVDGDLAHDLHPADHPPAWSTGILPLGASEPFGRPNFAPGLFGEPAQVFRLNHRLAAWARRRASDITLYDSAALAAARAPYREFAAGAQPPTVTGGGVLSAARFWHGPRHHTWAEQWVKFWTKGRGHLAVSSMEDSGSLGALRQLDRLGRADWRRVLVLRSVSNYTVPPPGGAAEASLAGEPSPRPNRPAASRKPGNFPGLEAALENAWRAGRMVVRTLIKDWPRPPTDINR